MKYEVYAARGYNAEKSEYRHYDGDKRRTLVLSDAAPGNGFVLVPKEYYRYLSREEMDWLTRSAVSVNSRWAARHRTEVEEKAGAFLDQFENELKEEAARLRDGENEGETENGGNGKRNGGARGRTV